MFNIKISPMLKPKIIRLIRQKGGIDSYSKLKNLNSDTIRRWLSGKRSFPFEVIEEISELFNKEIIEILDKEILTYERSKHQFRFNKKISLFEVNFLGWLLSEGSIEKWKRVNISQKNKRCLINLSKKLKKHLNLNSVIAKDHDGWKLRINNAAFTSYLLWRYGLSTGKKYYTVRVPKIIFKLSPEHKISFLAGYLEGDGCFTYDRRENKRVKYKVPRIFITSSSLDMLKDLCNIYASLSILSRINEDKKLTNPKPNPVYKLNVLKIKDCLKLAFYIEPYLIHPEKKERLYNIFKDPEILNCFRVKNRNALIKLIKHLNLKRKELPDYFDKNLDYKVAKSTINGWINGFYRPPLSIILHSCNIIKENYFNYLPREYSFLFKVHNIRI